MVSEDCRYVVLHEDEGTFLFCDRTCSDYEKAVGYVFCEMADRYDEWVEQNGYRLVYSKDFVVMEGGEGLMFVRKYRRDEPSIDVTEIYYILKNLEYAEEESKQTD